MSGKRYKKRIFFQKSGLFSVSINLSLSRNLLFTFSLEYVQARSYVGTGLYLQRVTGQSQHWKQIRGRIYSKLSASKMQSLNEVGLYHISSLFLTLAITSDVHMAEVVGTYFVVGSSSRFASRDPPLLIEFSTQHFKSSCGY